MRARLTTTAVRTALAGALAAVALSALTASAQPSASADADRLVAILADAERANRAGDLRQLRAPLADAVGLAERLGDRGRQADALRLLSNAQFDSGAFDEALASGRRAADLARDAAIPVVETRALRAVANALVSQGKHAEALEALARGLEVARRSGDRMLEADVSSAHASVYGPLGRFADAQRMLEAALALRGADSTAPEQVSTLSLLGVVSRTRGDYDAAMRYYERALTLARAQSPGAVGGVLGNLALVYTTLGQLDRAADLLHEAVTLATAQGRTSTAAINERNLAGVYLRQGRIAQANDHLEKALALSRTLGNPDRIAGALTTLATLRLTYQHDPDGAETAAREALTLATTARLATAEASALLELGRIAHQRGRHDEAITHLDAAVEKGGPRSLLVDVRTARAEAYLATGKLAEAEADLRLVLRLNDEARRVLATDAEKSEFGDAIRTAVGRLADVLVARDRVGEALEVAESGRARALADLLAQRAVRGQAGSQAAMSAVRDVADEARARDGRPGVDPVALRARLDDSVERLRREGPELASLLTAEAPNVAAMTAVAARLGATLVEYLVVGDSAHAWVVRPDGAVHHAGLSVSESALNAEVEPVRRSIDERRLADRDLDRRLRTLHETLIAPLARWLPADPGAPVVIVADRVLQLLPFAALTDAAGSALVDRHTLTFAPSLGVFAFTRRRPAGPRDVLVVSDPQPPDPAALPRLAGARREGVALARQLGPGRATVLEGAAATESAVKRHAARAGRLHFATHGLVSLDRPLATSLVLAKSSDDDGYLRLAEVFELDLDADLVVLSGCSTGVGPASSEGITGLVRGFLYAGAPTVVASLWDVGDRSTEVLMRAFYQALEDGAAKAAALRAAQRSTRRRFPHPAQWAAFQLTGEPE